MSNKKLKIFFPDFRGVRKLFYIFRISKSESVAIVRYFRIVGRTDSIMEYIVIIIIYNEIHKHFVLF